jgi:hypothetical protein
MDGGLYFFTIYDVSYGQKLGKDEETEFHIGFDCKYDDIHNFWPNKEEALDMFWALKERGLLVQHSDIWTLFHSNGTLEEVEKNIVDALAFHVSCLVEDGAPVPMELQGEWTPSFHLSTRAQLKYTDNYITRKALSKETGIAEQQLSHYANGLRHPRPQMQSRISKGIKTICQRLALAL